MISFGKFVWNWAKNVPSALFLGVIGRKNGLYQTIVQYAQQGEQMFVVQYGEN